MNRTPDPFDTPLPPPQGDDFIARLYDIALEPDRLEQLVGFWASRVAQNLHPGDEALSVVGFLGHDTVLPHLQRVQRILHSMMHSDEAGPMTAEDWALSHHHAALVLDRRAKIVTFNPAAQAAFGLSPGDDVAALGLDPADGDFLRQCVAGRMNSVQRKRLMRLRPAEGAQPLVALLVDPLGPDSDLVGLITNAVSWPAHLGGLLEASFGLTSAEVDVLRGLTLGQSVREIAEASNRSEGTVRSHIHALLAKTESRSQAELVRMALGLFDVAAAFGPEEGEAPRTGSLNNQYHSFTLPDGRRMDYLDLCDKRGKPVFWMPSQISLTRLPAAVEHQMARAGIRMIVPIRAGYGHSSALPSGADAGETGIRDMLDLMEHLKLPPVPIVCMVGDLHMACPLARRAPHRVRAIIGASATMPATEPAHFVRLDKFTRFVKANAEHAPRTLGFISMLFFMYAHRQGIRKFLSMVLEGSEPDVQTLQDGSVMDALTRGAHAVIRPDFKAHAAWAAEVISFSKDWRADLEQCPVPITLMVGDKSPWVPLPTVYDFAARNPNISVQLIPGAGQLLAYQHPDKLLAEIMRHLD